MSIFNNIEGSDKNKTINWMEDVLYSHRPGKISISNRNAELSSAIIITDAGVVITNQKGTGGVTFNDKGISAQGVMSFTSKSENIKKGEYSENPKAAKLFTYQETVLAESIPKEISSEVIGKASGINASVGVPGTNSSIGMDGLIPLATDIAPGPVPHFHYITTKHVHRIEPQYLYRIPSILNIISGATEQLKSFFSA